MTDLLPCGPFRQTSASLKNADLVLSGPICDTETPSARNSFCFFRTLQFPESFNFNRKWLVLCALGDNQKFAENLQSQGVIVKRVITKADHKKFPEHFINRLSDHFPDYGILLSEKDYVKLNPQLITADLKVVGQEIHIPEAVLEKIIREL